MTLYLYKYSFLIEFILFLAIIFLCSYSSYNLGKKDMKEDLLKNGFVIIDDTNIKILK